MRMNKHFDRAMKFQSEIANRVNPYVAEVNDPDSDQPKIKFSDGKNSVAAPLVAPHDRDLNLLK